MNLKGVQDHIDATTTVAHGAPSDRCTGAKDGVDGSTSGSCLDSWTNEIKHARIGAQDAIGILAKFLDVENPPP